MRKLRLSVIAGVLAIAAACSDSGDDPVVTTITVSPSSGSIEVLGGTLLFTATVLDQDGNAMTGQTVVWSTDDPNVASIDQSGRATALAEGSVTVSANVGAIAGTASLGVSSAPCTEELAMDPGDIRVLAVNCDIFIPSGASGDRYRVAILNKNSNGDPDDLALQVSQATLNVTPVGVVTAPAAAPVARARAGTALVDPIEMSLTARKHLRWGTLLQEQTRRAHLRLRESEATLVQALGTEGILPSVARAETGPLPQAADLPDRIMLRNNDGSSCTIEEDLTPAFLLAQNADLAVYQDSALNVASGTEVTAAEAQMMLDYYSNYGKGVIGDYFHGVPDVDANGKVIVYISFDDDLSDGATAAYVWGGDLFEATGDNACEASNEAELMYFNSALAREVDEGFAQALETTVHEVKHVSSFWQGIRRNQVLGISNPFQPSWIEEGTAEIAANVATRVSWNAIGGPAVNAMVTETDIRNTAFDSNDDIYPEALGIVIRMSRVQGYLSSQPNGVVTTPSGADDDHSVYGSGWTFLRWLGDAYGDAGIAPFADADLFTSQNDSTTQPGIAGIEEITGMSFGDLLEEFTGAVMVHRTGVPEGGLSFTSYDFVSSIEMFCFAADNPPCDGTAAGPAGTFPWPVTTTPTGVMAAPFDNAQFTGNIGATGMRIHEFVSDGTGSGIQLGITAQQPAVVVVTRVE